MLTRPCWVEINTRNFEQNYSFLSTLAGPQVELLAVVKANAYGHELKLCAPAVVRAGARWLGVTSVEEGVEARRLCPESRILVIGISQGQSNEIVRHKLTAVVWDNWQFDELEAAARAQGIQSVPVHLEIDTGMSRQGAEPDSLAALLERFQCGSPLYLEGVMTHLFAADEADEQNTNDQLQRMEIALKQIQSAGIQPETLNIGNSAALLAGQAIKISALAGRYSMNALIRPGLALYGLVPEFDPDFSPCEPASLGQARRHLHPVLTWKTRVVSVKSVPTGAVIGYNGTFVATEPMRLALIAVGYADGLDRQLGNRFSLLVRGQRAPLVGRVSMDQAVIDITGIPGVATGDEVVLIGQQGDEAISAFDHAKAAGTIPWEIFTRIAARVPRIAI
jgi:alanine racemase